jgi:type I restriction enzyme S subunit
LIFGTGGAASLHFVDGPFSASNDCYIAVPKSRSVKDAKFFYYFLTSNIHLIENGFRGAGLKHVSKSYLEEIELPANPQIDREAAIKRIDRAAIILRKRKEMLAMSDEFLKSAFLDKFGDPVMNPKGLPTAPIRQLGKVVTGNTPPRANPANYGSAIEWIKSDNINTPEHFVTRAEEHLSEAGKSIGRTAPAGSTLVTCIAGSPKVIGNAALTDRLVAFNQQINAVIPGRDTDPYFLYCQFLVGKKLVQAQSTNSMKGMVSKGKFQEINFLKPHFDTQREFGRLFEDALKSRDRIHEDCVLSERLFGSLTARAFRGEV